MRRWALAVALLVGALVPAVPAAAAGCPPTPFTPHLDDALWATFPGARFSASVLDLRDGCTYDLHPGRRMTTASVFKVEVLAGVLLRAQQEGRALTEWEASRIRPMISRSANPPTNELFAHLGGTTGIARLHRTFGLTETRTPSGTWGLTETTARDQVKLLRQVLLGGGPLADAGRRRALAEMTSVVPEQRWGITEGVPSGRLVALKNGFAGSPCCGWRLNSVGMVGGSWLVATFSDGWRSEGAGIEGNRFLNRTISTRLARVPVGAFPTAEAWVGAKYAQHRGRPPRFDERIGWSAVLHQGGDPDAAEAWIRDSAG